VFQLVRRAHPSSRTAQPGATKQNFTRREDSLTTALITVLSVNIFMVSSVLSFCLFVFWYPH
jgi:hypothetical protein